MVTEWFHNETAEKGMQERYKRSFKITTRYWCEYIKDNRPIGIKEYENKMKYRVKGKKQKMFLLHEILRNIDGLTEKVEYSEYDGSTLKSSSTYKRYLDAEVNAIDSCIKLES